MTGGGAGNSRLKHRNKNCEKLYTECIRTSSLLGTSLSEFFLLVSLESFVAPLSW